jgi:hypothetical protein
MKISFDQVLILPLMPHEPKQFVGANGLTYAFRIADPYGRIAVERLRDSRIVRRLEPVEDPETGRNGYIIKGDVSQTFYVWGIEAATALVAN